METPLVSIITPCYNAEKTISETIDSIIAQTYTNWELFVIDDCSTDTSAAVVEKYCLRDCRIKLLKTEEPSGSPAIPRNIGIEASSGRYVAFVDSDDVWLPPKLEEQVRFMEENDFGFVYSNCEKMTYEGMRNNRVVKNLPQTSYRNLLEYCSIASPTVIICRKVIGNIRFLNTHQEDYIFWLQILKKGYIAYNTCKIHALYRESPSSRSSNKFKMFVYHWNILRKVEAVKMTTAVYYMFLFAMYGFRKYLQ
jgi:teichuronic acid biosynthesis glycosyltransferase TuaG